MANPRGQQRDKPFRDALRMEIAAAGKDHKKLRRVARALLAEAEDGNINAIKEVADRLDGRVAQQITGADEGPIEVVSSTSVENLSDDELATLVRLLEQVAGSAAGEDEAESSTPR